VPRSTDSKEVHSAPLQKGSDFLSQYQRYVKGRRPAKYYRVLIIISLHFMQKPTHPDAIGTKISKFDIYDLEFRFIRVRTCQLLFVIGHF